MDNYNSKRHAVYMCTYHMIFVTRCRRPVINEEIGEFLKARTDELARNMKGEILSSETGVDYIHLLVSLPPDVMPMKAVIAFKTQLSRSVHESEECMAYVKQYIQGDAPFWNQSYFVATTGSVSSETVKQYIESQRTDEHKRKYIKSGKPRRKSKRSQKQTLAKRAHDSSPPIK